MSSSMPQDPVAVPDFGGQSPRDASASSPELHDKRALRILAKTIYRELREAGLAEEDVMCVASELLSQIASDVKDRRR
jgi:hypothetical protein